MNTVQPSPQPSEPASLSLSFVNFPSTRPTHPQPAPTRTSDVRTAALSKGVNTLSLIMDPTANPEPPSAPAASQTSSHQGPASSVLIITITLPILATAVLGALLVWYLIRRRRRRRAEPTSCSGPNILRRPRRPSDFWSADASKPESRPISAMAVMMATTPISAQNSPRTPNENTGLLRQDGAMQQLSRSMELVVAAGLAGGANARNPGLAPNVGVDHGAMVSNDIQQPMSAYYPEHPVSSRNADVEQQVVDWPSMGQPQILESYLYEPRAFTRRITNPISPLALPSPVYGGISDLNTEQTFEPAQPPIQPSQPSPPPPRCEFSDLTFISMEPFAPNDQALGPATQSSHVLSRAESPALSMLSSTEPRPSFSSSHLPCAPRPTLQPDVSQALTNLQRPVSRSTYFSYNSSTTGTFSTIRKPRLNIILNNPNHPPNAFTPGYFTHPSPKTDIFDGPQFPRPSLDSPSVTSVRSNPFYLWAFRNGSDSLHGSESELDGVRYSREEGCSSPALPDSVRTSVLSFFERRR